MPVTLCNSFLRTQDPGPETQDPEPRIKKPGIKNSDLGPES